MAEAELNTSTLSISQLLSVAACVTSALKDNPHFPNPDPDPARLQQIMADLAMAEAALHKAREAANHAQTLRDDLAATLRDELAREVAYVQKISDGDATKILSAGLHLEEGVSLWPFGTPGDMEEILASAGDLPGEIDLAWDPLGDATGYEVEMTSDLYGKGPWQQASATVKSKATIERLASHGHYWFRVRAVNERGAGDWSPPVMKLAP